MPDSTPTNNKFLKMYRAMGLRQFWLSGVIVQNGADKAFRNVREVFS